MGAFWLIWKHNLLNTLYWDMALLGKESWHTICINYDKAVIASCYRQLKADGGLPPHIEIQTFQNFVSGYGIIG